MRKYIGMILLTATIVAGCQYQIDQTPTYQKCGVNKLCHITEDSPGWDCHTMGNRICG